MRSVLRANTRRPVIQVQLLLTSEAWVRGECVPFLLVDRFVEVEPGRSESGHAALGGELVGAGLESDDAVGLLLGLLRDGLGVVDVGEDVANLAEAAGLLLAGELVGAGGDEGELGALAELLLLEVHAVDELGDLSGHGLCGRIVHAGLGGVDVGAGLEGDESLGVGSVGHGADDGALGVPLGADHDAVLAGLGLLRGESVVPGLLRQHRLRILAHPPLLVVILVHGLPHLVPVGSDRSHALLGGVLGGAELGAQDLGGLAVGVDVAQVLVLRHVPPRHPDPRHAALRREAVVPRHLRQEGVAGLQLLVAPFLRLLVTHLVSASQLSNLNTY